MIDRFERSWPSDDERKFCLRVSEGDAAVKAVTTLTRCLRLGLAYWDGEQLIRGGRWSNVEGGILFMAPPFMWRVIRDKVPELSWGLWEPGLHIPGMPRDPVAYGSRFFRSRGALGNQGKGCP